MISFSCLLVYQKTYAFKPKTSLDILINLPDKALERGLVNEEIRRLLVPVVLSESNRTWAVSVGLLHSSSGRCSHSGSLNGKMFAGGFPPVNFLAVCLTHAMLMMGDNCVWNSVYVVGRVFWEGVSEGGREEFFSYLYSPFYTCSHVKSKILDQTFDYFYPSPVSELLSCVECTRMCLYVLHDVI